MRRHLQDETGVALVVAISVLFVLATTGATVVYFAGAGSRHAESSAEDARALNLAEAGLGYARSLLWNAADPTQASAVPSGTLTLEGGVATYSGTYDPTTRIWTLTGTGTYANPTGGTTPVVRTATSEVAVVTGPAGVHPAWFYNYSDTLSGCLRIEDDVRFDAPLYVRGSLCLEDDVRFSGSSLHVGGTFTAIDNASAGSATAPIPEVNVTGGCTGGNPDPHPCVSGPADRVWDADGVITRNPTTLTKPSVDLTYWYVNASPGPRNPCTVGSVPGGFDSGTGGTAVPPNPNRSRPTFNLTPGSPYSCQTASGRLSWTPGNPGTLLVDGTIFFDGNIRMTDGVSAVYRGRATIYSSGSVTLTDAVRLCGIAGCTASWDASANYLVFVAGASSGTGFTLEDDAVFQGGAYVVSNYRLEDSSRNWGPVIANQFTVRDASRTFLIPPVSLPAGAPGITPGRLTLQNVPDSYRSSG